MLIKIVATLCQLTLSPGADAPGNQDQPARCEDHTQFAGEGDMQMCMTSPAAIADWKEHSEFAGPTWTVTRIKCFIGKQGTVV